MSETQDRQLLEGALAGHPQVDDCAVVQRTGSDGSCEWVCYVVTPSPEQVSAWVSDAARQTGVTGTPISGVAVVSLPLGTNGNLDVGALEALPVLDRASIAAWEEQARTVARVTGAAVVRGDWVPVQRALHVSDIARPGWLSDGRSESEGAVKDPSAPSGTGTGLAVSVSHGGPLDHTPDSPATLDETLRRAAVDSPDRAIKYVKADGSLEVQSYQDLIDDAQRLLGGLREAGFGPGDRALFQFDQNRDFITTLWACILGGVIPVPVPVPPTYGAPNAVTEKLAAAWEMLGHPGVLTSARHAEGLRELGSREGLEGFRVHAIGELKRPAPDTTWHGNRPEDVAMIMLTSGSTGTPKGVRLTHANLLARSTGSVQMNGFTRDEITLNWMPLDHVAGILFFHLRDVFLACDQLQCPTNLILGDPLRWMDLIDQHRCTITFAPNFAYGLVNDRAAQMSGKTWDLSCMQFVLNGAESIVARTARRFMELLMPFGLPSSAMWPAWGMSEVSSGVTYSADFSFETVQDDDSFVEVGRPIPGVSLRIVDDSGQLLPEGSVGNLEVTGATLMSGYYDTSLNADAFADDGWFKTGDLAVIRNGALTITGRAKDVIIINSVNYYSHELEAVVEELPGVSTSFVAACPVRESGHDTDSLAIFFHADVTDDQELLTLAQSIRQQCVRRVGANPDYLLPVDTDQIPKTEIGKIQRPLLARRFAEGAFDEIRKRMDLLMRNERTVPDWFYRRIWQRSDHMRERPDQAAPGICVVFLDGSPLGDELCAELDGRGLKWIAVRPGSEFAAVSPGRYEIDPLAPAQFDRLFEVPGMRGVPVTRTVHLWELGEVPDRDDGATGLSGRLHRGAISLLHWIQALGRHRAGDLRSDVLVVSSATQHVAATDIVDPARAAMLGLVNSAPQELPWVRCRHIDVSPTDPSVTAATLLREMSDETSEREVAYREGSRFVTRLDHVDLPYPGETPPIESGGCYLLAGGLGGVGFEVSRFLVERFGTRLLIVDRSPLDSQNPGAASSEKPGRLAVLREMGGEVRHVVADVADALALERAVAEAERAWGRPLDGVIHMAGIYEERGVLDETRESFESVLHPKLQGAWALSQLLADRPDASFLGFSSVVGFFGGALVGAYACANAALEATVAGMDRSKAPRVCAGWSTWQDLGISRAFQGSSLLRAKGYLPITTPQGLISMLGTLNQPNPVVYVGLDGSNPQIRRRMNTRICARQQPSVFYATDACSEDDRRAVAAALAELTLRDRFGVASPVSIERLDELPLDGRGHIDRAALASARRLGGAAELQAAETDLERTITGIWKATLRREQIDVRDNFFDLGGNSLLLSQVSGALGTELGREVSLTEMFQFPSIRSLAEYLEGGSSAAVGLDATLARGSARTERMLARRRRSRPQ